MKIYLASKSPRRKELLTQMEIPFELLLVDTPEIIAPDETAENYSLRIIQEKLDASWEVILHKKLPIMPILCADTEVVLDGKILGKPQDYQDAFNMLRNYSGRSHDVITGIGVKYFDYEKVVIHATKVTFANIPDEAIHHYLTNNQYLDKAGSYGIQSYIGQFISHIDGCFYSVMGLPLSSVRALLTQLRDTFPELA